MGAFFAAFTISGGEGGEYPAESDVRKNVEYDTGMIGNLVLPATYNVKKGIKFGASGTEYTGTLLVSPLPTPCPAPAPSLTMELAAAFQDLQAEFHSVSGSVQKVKIDGKEYEAIIEEVEYDDIVTAGGEGDDGGFRCMIAMAIHPKKPKQGAEIEARGDCKEILSCVNTNGVTWTIVAGNPATE